MTGRTKVLLGATAVVAVVGFILWRTVRLKGRGFGGYPEGQSPSSVMYDNGGSRPYPVAKRARAAAAPEFVEKHQLNVRTKLYREPGWEKAKKTKVGSADDVYELLKGQGDLPQEEILSLCMNHQNQVQSLTVAHRGDPTAVNINPADILRPCVLTGATRVILVHNHPSGDATPSPADVAATNRVNEAGKILGIPVLDHIVVGERSFSSLRDLGLFRGN